MTFRISQRKWLASNGRYRVPSSAPYETEGCPAEGKRAAPRSHADDSPQLQVANRGRSFCPASGKPRPATTAMASQNPSLIALRCAAVEGAKGRRERSEADSRVDSLDGKADILF